MVQTCSRCWSRYAAYLVAEALHVSGILAVVASGCGRAGRVKGLSADSGACARGMADDRVGLQRHGGRLLGCSFAKCWPAVATTTRCTRGVGRRALGRAHGAGLAWVWASAHVRFRLHWGLGRRAGGPIRSGCSSWAGRRCAARSRSPQRCRFPCSRRPGAPFPERDLVGVPRRCDDLPHARPERRSAPGYPRLARATSTTARSRRAPPARARRAAIASWLPWPIGRRPESGPSRTRCCRATRARSSCAS